MGEGETIPKRHNQKTGNERGGGEVEFIISQRERGMKKKKNERKIDK